MIERPGTPRSPYIDVEVAQRLLKAFDFIILGLGALAITFDTAGLASAPDNDALVGFFCLELVLLSMLALRSLGLYEIASLRSGFRSIALSLAVCLVCGALNHLVAKVTGLLDLPVQWFTAWALFTALYFAATRGIAALWAAPLDRAGRFRRRIAIVGGGKAAEEAIATLEASPDLDIDIVGLFDDRFDDRSPQSIGTHKKLGSISELAFFAREHRVDLIIVAIPLSAEARLLQILKRLWELPVDIRISGQASKLKLSPRAYTQLGNLPLLAVFDRPLTGWGSFLKSTMDRGLAVLLIVVLSPILALTALAVRLDSKGPILFKQRRYGFNNELIEVYKFRSMYADRSDANAIRLVSKGDPRVTPVGRFIRKTSIDELPQLFNVLTGQLSLVGPRPHATQAKAQDALYEQVVDGYFARHRVKPGITGWAQINGWRGETDTKEKIEQRVLHDLDYIDQWSLGFDLYILAKTPLALLKTQNAY
ncbi:undecaprenyl-phosphate glucose phosphotransferase [Taklimakanibacter deserti]|uniref:undecaprenyl-phosphate glucose phosphotransferase n=1 Tax=Taklimakanibacter deserti TaxID=2267839 RepID=UPI0034D682D1